MDNILSLLGLARRAGSVVSGEFAAEKAVKQGKAHLVIVAEDASSNTKKLFTDKCASYGVPCRFYADKEALGHAIGEQLRASAAVTDQGFAASLLKKLDQKIGGQANGKDQNL